MAIRRRRSTGRYVEYVDRESELHANTLEEKMKKQAKIGKKQQLSALE